MNETNPNESRITSVPPDGSIPLRPKWEIYARERSLLATMREAERRAGLAPGSGAGTRLERKPEVQARIAWFMRDTDGVLAEKRKRLEEQQWAYVFKDIADFYDEIEVPIFDKKGEVVYRDGVMMTKIEMRPKRFSELAHDQRMCIKELSVTDSGKANLKLYYADDANDKLCKLHGFNKQPEGVATIQMSDKPLDERIDAAFSRLLRLKTIESTR